MTSHAIYAGTFDPFTIGHLEIATRASKQFDKLTIVVVENTQKQSLLPLEARLRAIRETFASHPSIEVRALESGLLVELAKSLGATALVRGVRSVTDFEYEVPMAHINRELSGIDTLMLSAAPAVSHISSSLVRQVWQAGGNVSAYLPPASLAALESGVKNV